MAEFFAYTTDRMGARPLLDYHIDSQRRLIELFPLPGWFCPGLIPVLIIALFPLLVLADASGRPTEASGLDSALTDPSHAREEDEESGIAISPWVTLFGQIELEWTRQRLKPDHGGHTDQISERPETYQLGFMARPWSNSELLLVLEYASDTDQLKADEASIMFASEPWEIRAGKFYTPFGSYLGNFINGPILEFGETRASGASLSYSAGELPDLSFMLYHGEADDQGRHSEALDWAVSLDSRLSEQLSLGLSYQSDLADSDERLLAEYGDRFARKVDALGGFIHWTTEEFELSFEALGALHSFAELEADRNRPLAWNLELKHPLPADLHLAWRLEGSRELEDQPEIQAGVALIWEPHKQIAITLQYLHGKFRKGLATDDSDEPYRDVDTFSAMLTVGF